MNSQGGGSITCRSLVHSDLHAGISVISHAQGTVVTGVCSGRFAVSASSNLVSYSHNVVTLISTWRLQLCPKSVLHLNPEQLIYYSMWWVNTGKVTTNTHICRKSKNSHYCDSMQCECNAVIMLT